MAELIPSLNTCLPKMTKGEKKFARRIESLLDDDYLCWFDTFVGRNKRYPDFIILHPQRGLLFIEVKDWKIDQIRSLDKFKFSLILNGKLVTKDNPLEQARQCTMSLVNVLNQDETLLSMYGKYKDKLSFPYGYGVYFSNITRNQLKRAFNSSDSSFVLPEHMVICKDEATATQDPEEFQTMLWNMFIYKFEHKLTLPQINKIKGYIFPEIRCNYVQNDFLSPNEDIEAEFKNALPDMIKIMDTQQELLARSLGAGHRVVHGVAGSGKTLILGFRALQLSEMVAKPILILCFNISLASRLRSFFEKKSIGSLIHIYHFHDWCSQQIKTYNVDLLKTPKKLPYQQLVDTVISGVDSGLIPKEQYGAVLIDEGHDFEADWLKLVVGMVDKQYDHLLLLYDDAQSIYSNKSGLDFSLSSVGINARGRTTILRYNYRNTQEILKLSYDFSKEYIHLKDTDEDHIPIIAPESSGNKGVYPVLKKKKSLEDEKGFVLKCLRAWMSKGIDWRNIAIIYRYHKIGAQLKQRLIKSEIPFQIFDSSENKKNYDPRKNAVTLTSVHSSKGLEFEYVIVLGIGEMPDSPEVQADEAKLLYVAMTRAQQKLLLLSSKDNSYTRKIVKHLERYSNTEVNQHL